jgi:3-oxoadipate enol-lactonase/4-carboxymuconolactone decarboxylase
VTIPVLRCSVLPVRSGAPDARLIVLGPSLGTTSSIWDVAAAALAADHRVLRFDLPGHGFSPATTEPFTIADVAEAVLALVDSVGGGSFSYAGVSMGGAVGLELALRHPDRVTSLAAFSAPAVFSTPQSWHDRAAQVRASGTASVVGGSASRWFAPDYLQQTPGPGAAALDRLLEVDDESYALCCEALAAWDLSSDAASISVPTSCAAGRFDLVTTPTQVEALAGLIPGARFDVVDGAGHLPVLERPAETEAIIRRILAATEASDAAGSTSDVTTDVTTDASRHAAGMAVRRAVLGDAHVDAATAKITPETADFQDFITRYAWGEIWTRPGLTRRERSFITLSSLVTGGHENEIGMHVRAALTNGLSQAEISETILHTAIYAGVPAGNSAFAIARAVFAEIDAFQPDFSQPDASQQPDDSQGEQVG